MKATSLLRFSFFVFLGIALMGCVTSPVVPPGPNSSNAYSSISFPVDIAFGPNDIGPTRGESASCSVLGLVAWGDCSVETAAKNAGIKQVDHIDAHFFNVLGVYQKLTIIVHGKTAAQMKTPTSAIPQDTSSVDLADAATP